MDMSDKNDFRIAPEVVEAFTFGDCWALALAMTTRTGWSVVTLVSGEDPMDWYHCGVHTPEGTILDIQGEWDEQDWVEHWEDFSEVNAACAEYWTAAEFQPQTNGLACRYDEDPDDWGKLLLSSHAATTELARIKNIERRGDNDGY